MLSSLEALDEPLDSTPSAPRVSAFQPKAKPRAKKANNAPNAAGKVKTNVGDTKISKQLQPAKITLPETKPSVKENPLSPPPDETVGSQVIEPISHPESPVDVKPNVGPSSTSKIELDVGLPTTSRLSNPVEEKPDLASLVLEPVGIQEISPSAPSAIETIGETPHLGEDLVGSHLLASSSPTEEIKVSVPSFEECVGIETIPSLVTSVRESPVAVPLFHETVSREAIAARCHVLEETSPLIPSEMEPSLKENVSEERIPPPHPVPSENALLISSEPEPDPLHMQTVPSAVEGATQDDEEPPVCQDAINASPSPVSNPTGEQVGSVREDEKPTADDEGPPVSQDALNASPSPVSNPIGEQIGSVRVDEKPPADHCRAKRKLAATPHRFTTDGGETKEEAWKTKVLASSKRCKVRDQQSQNGNSEPRMKRKDVKESRKITSDSIEMSEKTLEKGENHSFLNAGDSEKRTNCIRNTNIPPEGAAAPISHSDNKTNDQRKGWRQKLKERNVADSSTMMPNFLEVRENMSISNTNRLPDKEVAPVCGSVRGINSQSKHCKMNTKPRKAIDDSATMQEEILSENSPVEFATGNNLDDQHKSRRKQQKQKIKDKMAIDDSEKMSQQILETENCFDSNSEEPSPAVVALNDLHKKDKSLSKLPVTKKKGRKVLDGSAIMQNEFLEENSPNELATLNDLNEQHNDKSKQQRKKRKNKKPFHDFTKMIQETPSEAPVSSNVETVENCFDTNVEVSSAAIVPSDDLPDKNNSHSRPTALSKYSDYNDSDTGKDVVLKTSEDQQLNETPSEAPVPSKMETASDNLPDKNNSQSRRRKRKPTALSKSYDCNDSNTGMGVVVQTSEDQELNGNATGKQKQKKKKASTSGKSLELSKKKFSHSSGRQRRRAEKHLLEIPEGDLDPKKLKIKDLIRLAEAKERIRNKEEAANKKLQSSEAPSDSNANERRKEPQEDEGDILAPQVKIVNGEIVINEESLVVSHRDLSTDDFRTYRRVEETHSKLNYHTYMNHIHTERWTKLETERFYKAIQQFGTDFAMIQKLFPDRTRRQVKAKFKVEERKNPLQLSDVLMHRPEDHSHFEMLIDRLNISRTPVEHSNPDGKDFTSTGLEDITFQNSDEAQDERENVIQINSTVDIPETQEREQPEKIQVKEKDSTFSVDSSQDISQIQESNKSQITQEDLDGGKEASPIVKNASDEPTAKPEFPFSYQAGPSKRKSLFSYKS